MTIQVLAYGFSHPNCASARAVFMVFSLFFFLFFFGHLFFLLFGWQAIFREQYLRMRAASDGLDRVSGNCQYIN